MEQEVQKGVEVSEKKKRDWLLPVSILVAAIMVSVSLIYSAGRGVSNQPSSSGQRQQQQAGSPENMKPVSSADHVRGNPNAPVTVVEYSDFECPFCKEFHNTMEQVITVYGDRVNWVYRHAAFHQKAPQEAEASECVASLGGNNAFWKFNDEIFKITPSNNGLDLSQLPQIAVNAGVDKTAFDQCMSAGTFKDLVVQQTQEGIDAGLQGTPYIIVINNQSGKKYIIPGAVPFESRIAGQPSVKQVIDTALANK